ncbi:MAG: OmpW family outer membrane protein [Steroidobacter sp.]
MTVRRFCCAIALAFASCSAAVADDDPLSRHWTARIGVHPVNPQSNSHTDFTIENASGLSLGATYLFSRHWGAEFFSAFPMAHELHEPDAARVGSFKMIPSSATIQYYVSDAADVFRAYGAIGVAHTTFGSEKTSGALSDHAMKLADSTGMTMALGLDVNLDSNWYVNLDARWMDIDSDLTLDGAASGQLQIDPYLFGLSVGRRLR